jgi:hypothetical protein
MKGTGMDQEQINDTAMFKWVQHTPAGRLKALTDKRLQEIREALIKEVREVGRALQWVDGIIKLKVIEQEKQDSKTRGVSGE